MIKKILSLFIILTTLAFSQSQKEITIKIVAENLQSGDEVFIAGNEFGYWEPDESKLEKTSDSTFEKTFLFEEGTELEFKFTRGSWQTEALDSNGIEYPNFTYFVESDTILIYEIPSWRDKFSGISFLSLKRLTNKNGSIELLENWKYNPDDDSAFASPTYDDKNWRRINPLLQPEIVDSIKWDGKGWFRLSLKVDSSLWNYPLAFISYQTGASEIYLNGDLIFSYGTVGNSQEEERAYSDNIPRIFSFPEKEEQLLAVRYSNFASKEFSEVNVQTGFYSVVGSPEHFIFNRIAQVRGLSIYQIGFFTLSLALAVIHFLLFAFYPKSKDNLYYSFSMLGFAALVYSSFQYQFINNPVKIILLNHINAIGVITAAVFGLLTAYQSVYKRLPRQAYFFLSFGFLAVLGIIFIPMQINWLDYLYYGFLILTSLEILRVIIVSFRYEKKTWGWITGAGFLAAMLAIFYQILINSETVEPIGGVYLVYVYGLLVLAVSVSINLSREIATTNKNLEKQLDEVKRLSEKTLQQERRAREEEISRRLLEADNQRKTKELEEARILQLSMLPQEIPSHPKYDIAVKMKAASEVGGDYYDFNLSEDHLTIAIGDATGHGMRAGTMVATIKGLFQSYRENSDLLSFFEKCNNTIKSMNLGNLYMAMQMAKFEGSRVTVSSAGMPSVLIFRKRSGLIDEITVKGMPLGGFNNFPYTTETTDLKPGDKIVFMSDGFPELFNAKEEMIGYEKMKDLFAQTARKTPEEIINYFFNYADKWMNGNKQNDDMTFMVVERK